MNRISPTRRRLRSSRPLRSRAFLCCFAAVSLLADSPVQRMEDYAFDPDTPERKTDAVLLIKNGETVYERYARGYDETTKHYLWSVGKSLLNALTAIAVKKKGLALDHSICRYGFRTKCAVRVAHLLHWRSCLFWREAYEKNPENSDVIRVLYGEESADGAAYVHSRPFVCEPGETHYYSTGDSILLSAVLRNLYGQEYGQMPWRELFAKIGMENVSVERDGKGLYRFETHAFATARDLARFGNLYLEPDDLLPKGWVASIKPVGDLRRFKNGDRVPAAHFWGNQKGHLTDAPEDSLMAQGHWGQFLVIIPSLKVVMVRLGDNRDESSFSIGRFVPLALDVVQ